MFTGESDCVPYACQAVCESLNEVQQINNGMQDFGDWLLSISCSWSCVTVECGKPLFKLNSTITFLNTVGSSQECSSVGANAEVFLRKHCDTVSPQTVKACVGAEVDPVHAPVQELLLNPSTGL